MTGERHVTLDAMRGLAVMGILLINIIAFSMPGDAYINPQAWGGWGAADRIVWTINQLLFEGRMRGLFALLFGASMLLVMQRAHDAGRSPVAVHLRRMAVLLLFGIAHFTLVWDGDILVHYAVLGCVLWLARGWPVGRLVAVAALVLLVHTLIYCMMFGGALAMQQIALAPGASAETAAQFRTMTADFPHPGSANVREQIEVFRGGYGAIVRFRTGEHGDIPLKLLTFVGGETIGYMLLGMALMKSGFFTGGWSRTALLRLTAWGYGIGLPAIALMTWWAFASGFDPIVLMGNFLAWSVPFRVAVALGHAGLAVLLIQRAVQSAWVARIAATGRMAFTNYLMTSIVMTTIFYGYGLGLFGHVGRAEVYLFVTAMWAAMLGWSRPWLARFNHGPFEWVWRALARWELPQWRRNALASQSQST